MGRMDGRNERMVGRKEGRLGRKGRKGRRDVEEERRLGRRVR